MTTTNHFHNTTKYNIFYHNIPLSTINNNCHAPSLCIDFCIDLWYNIVVIKQSIGGEIYEENSVIYS